MVAGSNITFVNRASQHGAQIAQLAARIDAVETALAEMREPVSYALRAAKLPDGWMFQQVTSVEHPDRRRVELLENGRLRWSWLVVPGESTRRCIRHACEVHGIPVWFCAPPVDPEPKRLAAHVTITGCTIDFTAGGNCPLSEAEQDRIREEFAADIRRARTMADVIAARHRAEEAAIAQEGRHSRYGGASAQPIVSTSDDACVMEVYMAAPLPAGTPHPASVPVRIAEPLAVVR